MKKPRAYTVEECRKMLLDHARVLVKYWDNESRAITSKDKLEGLAFSMLTMLDGEGVIIPQMKIIPNPHPEDKQYHKDNGENWWPTNIDLGGILHEEFYVRS
jgi:hypothetical protein